MKKSVKLEWLNLSLKMKRNESEAVVYLKDLKHLQVVKDLWMKSKMEKDFVEEKRSFLCFSQKKWT